MIRAHIDHRQTLGLATVHEFIQFSGVSRPYSAEIGCRSSAY